MTRKTRKLVALASVIVGVSSVSAFAATSPREIGVPESAMNGVNRAVNEKGALKPNAIGNRQIKTGSVSCRKLSADIAAAICTGKPGAPGTPGAPGANGVSGSAGTSGAKGDKGDNGPGGSKGDPGQSSAAPEYGVAQVLVSRGGATAKPWATYSTLLGSPVGDNTGGTFRFTCSTDNAPCTVSVKAAGLGTGYVKVYPRVLIYSQSLAGGPETYCEYGDGSTKSGPLAIAKQDPTATPTYTNVPVNIGGSADCSGPVTTAGDVTQITVPAGYYDVNSTFVFLA